VRNEALAAFSQAREYDPNLETDARIWDALCLGGSLWEEAATVMHACERAVELAPDNGGIRNSRGIARALTGNLAGASEDFRSYLEWAPTHKQSEIQIAKRQYWLYELEAGRNPFDAATLEKLKNKQ
jgi:Flp pilus assembly protein TadD